MAQEMSESRKEFVDYMLNGSVEYLKRQYKKVFVPMGIAVLVILINPFTEILFSLKQGSLCTAPIR